MTPVCLYFAIHQPYHLGRHPVGKPGHVHNYADDVADRYSIDQLADECILPANQILSALLHFHNGKFRVSFSISGIAIELFQKYRPDVIASLQQLVATGYVEILSETYYHSLSSLHSKIEFARQVRKHSAVVEDIFGVKPSVFKNTELLHNNDIARQVAGLGLKGLLCDGLLSPHHSMPKGRLYTYPGGEQFGILIRDPSLSDDISFRFDDPFWKEHPLTAEKFAGWIHDHTGIVNLMMDYETFGVHKKKHTGIFDFLQALPAAVLSNENFIFSTPSIVLKDSQEREQYDSPKTASWAGENETSLPWSDNMMQHNTIKKIYSLEKIVLESGNDIAIETWGRLQAADYFFYMSDRVSKATHYPYQNPFMSASEAFQNYCDIVADLEIALIEDEIRTRKRNSRKPSLIHAIL